MKVTIGGGILLFIFYSTVRPYSMEGENSKVKKNSKSDNDTKPSTDYSTLVGLVREGEKLPFLFFELKVSYSFNPNTYEFNEELINWDYKGFRLGFE